MTKVKKPKTPRRRLLIALLVVLCLLVLGAGYTAAGIYAYGKQSSPASAEAAIVLGAAVRNGAPSPVFRERINHAIVLYRAGRVQKLLLTGGNGKEYPISESEAAKRYALQQGVPESAILTEDRSHTTWENLQNAREVAQQHGMSRFLIVTDPLHSRRAMVMAADLGLQAAPSPTPTTQFKSAQSQCNFLAHETFFYLDYRLWRSLQTVAGR